MINSKSVIFKIRDDTFTIYYISVLYDFSYTIKYTVHKIV